LLTQKFTAAQIASFYGVPPEYVTEAEGAKGYVTGLYARQMLWLQTGLLPRIRRLETALNSLLPENVYLKFNVDGLLRADPAERAALCTAMIQHHAMTPNEWRALEDLNPLVGGDEILQSVQFALKEATE
jgi:HK97 family phage portal protein